MKLSFDEFWAHTSDAMVLAATSIAPDVELVRDLGFDSLSMAELIAVLDELDAPVPEGLLAALETAGDVYDVYCNHLVVTVGR